MGNTFNMTTTIERALVVRVDCYELPHLALVPESELAPGEEAEIIELDVDCDVYAVSCPAQLCGPPENCHPDESEFSVEEVTPSDDRFAGIPVQLTEREEDALAQQAWDNDPMDYYDDPPGWDDYPEECYG